MRTLLVLLMLSMFILANASSREKVDEIYTKYRSGNYEALTKEEALEILKLTKSIDGERTGFSNSESLGHYAYGKIKESEDLLVKLFTESETNEGKIYALMGLWSLNKELYGKYYDSINKDNYVSVFPSGCIGTTIKIGDYFRDYEHTFDTKKDRVRIFDGYLNLEEGWTFEPRKDDSNTL